MAAGTRTVLSWFVHRTRANRRLDGAFPRRGLVGPHVHDCSFVGSAMTRGVERLYGFVTVPSDADPSAWAGVAGGNAEMVTMLPSSTQAIKEPASSAVMKKLDTA